MDELSAPDCQVFIDAEIAHSELVSLTAPILFVAEDQIKLEVEVLKNADYDSNRRRAFPDGFVYFRYMLDLYMSGAPVERQAEVVSRLLTTLWDWGFSAVAACAFEDRLPQHGGYQSRAIPWPN